MQIRLKALLIVEFTTITTALSKSWEDNALFICTSRKIKRFAL